MSTIVHLVMGARPNFMKVAPLYHELVKRAWARPVLIHTGQHASPEMSGAFLRDLRLPEPDFHLDASGGSHAKLTGAVMIAYEDLLLAHRPDWVVVVGDVNSTLAACLAAKKLNIPVAHLEAGTRSFDRTMPEEQNRVVVDALCDLLWPPSADAVENLRKEGAPDANIDLVGNIMIDAYEMLRDVIEAHDAAGALRLGVKPYAAITLHRPSNVDDPVALARVVEGLETLADEMDLVFPIHPRTKQRLNQNGLAARLDKPGVRLIEPMSYIEFMSLVRGAALVVTDSGGLQEEATHLRIPCLTMRPNTERPITITHGTNRLTTPKTLLADARAARAAPLPDTPIALWDGRAAARVADSLARRVSAKP